MKPLCKKLPVAKFYYTGTSQAPVQRTVILIDVDDQDKIFGYELRKGNEVKKLRSAPLKSYYKNKISQNYDYKRLTLLEALDEGV